MLDKATQTGRFGRKARHTKKNIAALQCTEEQIQTQCDDLLAAYHIRYLRIPDWIWTWLKLNAPPQIVKELSDRFGGMPDNMLIKKIDDRYNLLMALELKTATGRLRGKQKTWEKEIAVQVSRSPDETIANVNEFIAADYINRNWTKEILGKLK
ncbi:MAG: hypothetical protein PHV93_04590 [Candidatus Pacebacteria bacterium]|nr:hypothetical protein [Candidatus Paceibacterota bacterium]